MSHMFTATANTLTCTCTCMGSKSSVCLSGLLNQLYGWKVAIDAHLYIELHSDTEIHVPCVAEIKGSGHPSQQFSVYRCIL